MDNYKWYQEAKKYDWSNKKILFAGGTGFIGKRCVECFYQLGAEICVLSRKEHSDDMGIVYWKVDLEDVSTLEKYVHKDTFDFAIYLAARMPLTNGVKEDYYGAKNSTLDPFVNFCKYFIADVDRMIYASSIDVVGQCDVKGYNEETLPNMPTPYGLAKYCGELYVKAICGQYNTSCVILRLAQVYGPNEPVIKIIPKLCEMIKDDTEFILYTTGEEKRRYVYIDDAVQAIVRSVISNKKGVFNIAGEEVVSMNELIKIIQEVYGKKLLLERLNIKKGKDNIPDIANAQRLLLYKPEVSLKEGLLKINEFKE